MIKCCCISYILVITCSFRICRILYFLLSLVLEFSISNDNKIAPFIFIAGSVAIEHLRVIFELFVSLPWTMFDIGSELVWTIFLSCFELVSTCMDHMYVLVYWTCMDHMYALVWTCMDHMYALVWTCMKCKWNYIYMHMFRIAGMSQNQFFFF